MNTTSKLNLLIVCCAVSAGVHLALVPEHLAESAGAGGGFIAATVLLTVLIVALVRRPDSPLVVAATALTLVGLLVSYVLAITSGMPVLMPMPEPVESVALVTKAVELLGLAAALDLLYREPAAVVEA